MDQRRDVHTVYACHHSNYSYTSYPRFDHIYIFNMSLCVAMHHCVDGVASFSCLGRGE